MASQGLQPLLRVKRKRITPAAPELVVEGLLARDSKRRALADQLARLDVADDGAAAPLPLHLFHLVRSLPTTAWSAGRPSHQRLMEMLAQARPEAPTHALSTSEQTPVQYQHSPLPAAFNTAGNEQLFQLYDFAAEHQTAAVDSDGPPVSSPSFGISPLANVADLAEDTHAFNNSDDTEMYDFYTMNSDSPLSLERAQVIEHLPHVQIGDADVSAIVETSNDSDHDSEDSNAESFYANSYPEEENNSSHDGSQLNAHGKARDSDGWSQLSASPDSKIYDLSSSDV